MRALAQHPFGLHAVRAIDVAAAGKAAIGMVRALLDVHGPRIRAAVVAAPVIPAHAFDSSARSFDLFESGHPLPNEASVRAGRAALALADAAARDAALLVVLLSGGASALVAVPADGVSLDDKIRISSALLRAGTAIAPFNAVRKHLSAIKGGQLAARAGRSVTYAISDVHAPVEDDPAVIGSGPTVADATTFSDARAALADAGVWDAAPDAVRARIDAGVRGAVAETIKPGDARLAHASFVVAGGRQDALAGAEAAARALGYAVERVDAPTIGEAREAGHAFVARAAALARGGRRCVLAAGETTVTVRGAGRGGRNQEFVLGAIDALSRLDGAALASVGTDGVDGPTDAAGAIADSTSLARARAAGLDVARALAVNDAYPFFQALGDLIVTGPTGTNVGDLQILLR